MKRYRNVVGKKIRKHRNASEFSQSQLARKLQLSGLFYCDTTMVGKIESGIRSVYDYALQIIATVLKITCEDLLPSVRHTKGEIL